MTYAVHKKYDVDGKIVSEKKEEDERELYEIYKAKREKLVKQLKNEKIVDPELREQVDKEIEKIENSKGPAMISGSAGRIKYYIWFRKNNFFYIHKIGYMELSDIDSMRIYSTKEMSEHEIEVIRGFENQLDVA